jgi:SAM-dependent methyltransferase
VAGNSNDQESDFPAKWQGKPIDLVCPRDRGILVSKDDHLTCAACGTLYPIIGGVPVIIDDENSVFAVQDYVELGGYGGASYGTASDRVAGWRRRYRSLVTRFLRNRGPFLARFGAHQAVANIVGLNASARILVIGAGEVEYVAPYVVYTDVAFGSKAQFICDAHALPFPDSYFDGAICVAVLEHVADPWRCVEEIRRVLVPRGFVFADTPFLQPVHMGAYDFTRFTYLGHRRLFRWFDEIESGASLGPAASAAYAIQHVLLCLSDSRHVIRFMKFLGLLIASVIRPIDMLFRKRMGAYDAAAATYFFGRKRENPISDRELIGLYRGRKA